MFRRYPWQMMGSLNLSNCESCKITEKYKYWNEQPSAGDKYHFITSLSSQTKIPRKFIECFKGEELEGWWNLRGPSGNKWRVTIERSPDGSRVFKEGWSAFMKDHGIVPLGTTVHLVFTYAGNSTLEVLVFDETGCMPESAYFTTNTTGNANNMCSSSLHGQPNTTTTNTTTNNNNFSSDEKPRKRKRCRMEKAELIQLD